MRNEMMPGFRFSMTNLLTLGLGAYFVWQNRFYIQRQLEKVGVKTPLLKGGIAETAQSAAAKASGKIERVANVR